jgi:hypothetical protein
VAALQVALETIQNAPSVDDRELDVSVIASMRGCCSTKVMPSAPAWRQRFESVLVRESTRKRAKFSRRFR